MPAFGEQFKRFYPGLIPIEERLWRAWLREHEGDYDRFEYNVHVGEGITVAPRTLEGDPVMQQKILQQFRQATQKKIDVVGWQGGETTIFEVEERPGTRALGQLLTYEVLLPKSRPDVGTLSLALVAARMGLDMLEAFQQQGVIVYQVTLST